MQEIRCIRFYKNRVKHPHLNLVCDFKSSKKTAANRSNQIHGSYYFLKEVINKPIDQLKLSINNLQELEKIAKLKIENGKTNVSFNIM